MLRSNLHRAAAAAAGVAALALPVRATWSIVVVDIETREVCVAAATCLENFNLKKDLPVIRVEEGGGVSQGLIDFGGLHRKIIWDGLIDLQNPKQILKTLLEDGQTIQSRQFGIVAFKGHPESFSGSSLGLAFDGLTGEVGSLKYAIQGNVITGSEVVLAAEDALLNTPGDLTTRVMAGMEAARAMGGDGRCSCTTGLPFECGAPPKEFEKSAHVAFIVASRQGDVDGVWHPALGGATGDYYLSLQDTGDEDDPDPVIELQALYDAWRADLAGRPDHLLSAAELADPTLVADGVDATEIAVHLVDVEGVPLTSGGATITVEPVEGGDPLATVDDVEDHGDGTYTVHLTAGLTPGSQSLAVRADDGVVTATLWPYLLLELDPYVDLSVGVDALSAAAGGEAPFTIDLTEEAAGHPYLLLASASGTEPGIELGGTLLPLNPDGITTTTVEAAGGSFLPGSIGLLDDEGRAEASFVAPAGFLVDVVGLELSWAALDYAVPFQATSAVGLPIEP